MCLRKGVCQQHLSHLSEFFRVLDLNKGLYITFLQLHQHLRLCIRLLFISLRWLALFRPLSILYQLILLLFIGLSIFVLFVDCTKLAKPAVVQYVFSFNIVHPPKKAVDITLRNGIPLCALRLHIQDCLLHILLPVLLQQNAIIRQVYGHLSSYTAALLHVELIRGVILCHQLLHLDGKYILEYVL